MPAIAFSKPDFEMFMSHISTEVKFPPGSTMHFDNAITGGLSDNCARVEGPGGFIDWVEVTSLGPFNAARILAPLTIVAKTDIEFEVYPYVAVSVSVEAIQIMAALFHSSIAFNPHLE